MQIVSEIGYLERIEHLEAEVAYLRSEVVLDATAQQVADLADAFKLSPSQAWIVAALLNAKPGKAIRRERLLDDQPFQRPDADHFGNTVDVQMSRIRRRLGHDAVETVRAVGFRLTDAGRARITEKVS